MKTWELIKRLTVDEQGLKDLQYQEDIRERGTFEIVGNEVHLTVTRTQVGVPCPACSGTAARNRCSRCFGRGLARESVTIIFPGIPRVERQSNNPGVAPIGGFRPERIVPTGKEERRHQKKLIRRQRIRQERKDKFSALIAEVRAITGSSLGASANVDSIIPVEEPAKTALLPRRKLVMFDIPIEDRLKLKRKDDR